ncbi:beta-phosphoglucomutase [Anaerobacillus sp. CMMVII]|uniref:beta-phosphoglucomutase n=1 Tax=Anaerobacillus sp. CMMVII TaxID=2755588 RepID=UPI0021B6FF62|nr:beta-phosphoglucomutase [Anaerobacillus sp. CMMVII]MCT8137040.1 beta-phosphoglucomutase [Anaerobacillus sp. CMMVII]
MDNNLKAVIFDLDGVITDTAEYHFLAWRNLAESLGISFTRDQNELLKGISRMESLDLILELGGKSLEYSDEEKIALAERKNENYLKLISNITPKDILPGIKELLVELKGNDIKIGLASASKNAFQVINSLELNDYFDFIVNAANVKNGKPDPEIFRTAADILQVSYENCVGIEDAEAGVAAIKAANMFAIGIGSEEALKQADVIYKDTTELTYAKIVDQFKNSTKI